MAFFERLLRFALGAEQRLCPLLKLFQADATVQSGIILEEIGLPQGGVTTWTWSIVDSSGFLRKIHRRFDEKEANPDNVQIAQLPPESVRKALSLLQESSDLGNYLSQIRDGGIYRLIWGTREQRQNLTFDNPPSDSKHFQLVSQLKQIAADHLSEGQ